MKSSGICSQALAVCEKVGLLSQFLQYYSAKPETKVKFDKNQPRG